MQTRTKALIGTVLSVAIAVTAVGVGLAAGGDDDGSDAPLTGGVLDRATRAALASTDGGEVLETEAGDDGAAYAVEIRLPDGSVVEVQLDEDFNVTGTEGDDDGADTDASEDG